jgi:hypothetical protein
VRPFAWSARDRIALLAGAVLPLLVSLALMPFRASIAATDVALVLVVAIVGVAANGHRPAGITAAVSAALWFDFLFTRPYQRFDIAHRLDVETTVLLLIVGAAVTELAVRGRRQRIVAATDESYLAAIAATTELVASGAPSTEIVREVQARLAPLLELTECRFERTRFGGMPRLDGEGSVRIRDRSWDFDQYGMPDSPIELLVAAQGQAYGRFVLVPTPGRMVPLAARRVAATLAHQAGAAFAGQRALTS